MDLTRLDLLKSQPRTGHTLDLRSGASMYYPSWLSRIVARNVVTKPLHRLAIGDLFLRLFLAKSPLPRRKRSVFHAQPSAFDGRSTLTQYANRALPARVTGAPPVECL